MTTILVTGCARGLGLAAITHLLSLPADHPTYPSLVFATYRSEHPSAELAALGESAAAAGDEEAIDDGEKGRDGRTGRLVLVRLDDVADEDDVERAMRVVGGVLEEREGSGRGRGLDVLVNNAGVMHRNAGGVEELSPSDLSSVLRTNVTGTHLVTTKFLPLLKAGRHKKILNMSSTLGSIALSPSHSFNCEAYKISKAALNALTVEWAVQLGESGSGSKRTAGGAVGGKGEGEGGREENKEGWCVVAFSPGWLQTALGGPHAQFPVQHGAEAVVDIIGKMNKQLNGKFIADDGSFPPW